MKTNDIKPKGADQGPVEVMPDIEIHRIIRVTKPATCNVVKYIKGEEE